MLRHINRKLGHVGNGCARLSLGNLASTFLDEWIGVSSEVVVNAHKDIGARCRFRGKEDAWPRSLLKTKYPLLKTRRHLLNAKDPLLNPKNRWINGKSRLENRFPAAERLTSISPELQFGSKILCP